MKKCIVILLLLNGCDGIDGNPKLWIEHAKKPIACLKADVESGYYCPRWTLIDADGDIFITARMCVNLPDTIKSNQP